MLNKIIKTNISNLKPSTMGYDFEGLMLDIKDSMTENQTIGLTIPTPAMELVMEFSKDKDINIDIVMQSVLIYWVINYDKTQDPLFPVYKFSLQQLLRDLKPKELELIVYLSNIIGESRFADAQELQDVDGVTIYGEDLIFHEKPNKVKPGLLQKLMNKKQK